MTRYAVQSVVFDKPHFTVPEAIKWLQRHDFKHPKVDETDNKLRFRQEPPHFDSFFTKRIRKHISLIIGYYDTI